MSLKRSNAPGLAAWVLTVFLMMFSLPVVAELPFLTEEAETLRPGAFSLDIGVAFRSQPVNFGTEDRDRQLDLGVTRFSFGLGKFAELQVSGVVQAVIEDQGETSTNSGDWVFGTKIWLLQEKGHRPALAFLYQVKLPNGSDEDGGATDETDFFGFLVATKAIGKRDLLHGNLGLGILGNPFANSAQNDIFILRLAWERKLSENRLFGIEGMVEGGPEEGDDPAFVGAVFAQKVGKWAFYTSAALGLNEDSDNFRTALGFRRELRLWRPGEPTRRNAW